MIKKLFLFLVFTAFSLHAATDQQLELIKAWKDGVTFGIRLLPIEYTSQGIDEKIVHLKKYAVVLNTDKLIKNEGLSTTQIILYKSFGLREGLTPILLKNKLLVFASYNNPYDADELVASLNQNYFSQEDRKVYRFTTDPNATYKLAPFAFADILYDMMEKVKERYKSKVVVVPDSSFRMGFLQQPPKPTPTQKKEVKPLPLKVKMKSNPLPKKPIKRSISKKKIEKKKSDKMVLKSFHLTDSKAMSYIYSGKKTGYTHKWNNSFKEMGLIENNQQQYQYSHIIETQDGEKYVQIYNTETYFDVYDVTFDKENQK